MTTLIVSVVALVVSFLTAVRTWISAVATFRSQARNNYMNALFDLNRQAIANPDLWSVYDAVLVPASNEPLKTAQRLAFVWYHLNLFEVVHADYTSHRLIPRDRVDELHWESLQNFMSTFLAGSEEAQRIVKTDGSARLLNRAFVDFLRGKLPLPRAA